MKVLVDTSAWSLALRRRRKHLDAAERALALELSDLIRHGRTVLIGPIRQELLTGIRDERSFDRLRHRLRAFDDEPLSSEDYEQAGRCANRCRSVGLAGSPTDFLICAVAILREFSILTTDDDFPRYARQLPIRLHTIKRRAH